MVNIYYHLWIDPVLFVCPLRPQFSLSSRVAHKTFLWRDFSAVHHLKFLHKSTIEKKNEVNNNSWCKNSWLQLLNRWFIQQKKRFNYLDHFWFLKFVFFTPKASLRKFYSVYRKILLIKYMNRSWSADTHTRKKTEQQQQQKNNNKKQENLLFFSISPINQIYLLPDVIYTPTPECVISILQHLQNIYCGHLFAQK